MVNNLCHYRSTQNRAQWEHYFAKSDGINPRCRSSLRGMWNLDLWLLIVFEFHCLYQIMKGFETWNFECSLLFFYFFHKDKNISIWHTGQHQGTLDFFPSISFIKIYIYWLSYTGISFPVTEEQSLHSYFRFLKLLRFCSTFVCNISVHQFVLLFFTSKAWEE